ncbi:MAG: DUF748 domain-containing protein [Candidatus Binataceae bacterium]
MAQAPNSTAPVPPARRFRVVRRVALVAIATVAIFTVAGFLGVPQLLRYLARGPLTVRLHRQVTVGKVTFNPYTLRLTVDYFHLGEHDNPQAFADIGQVRVKASWRSFYRLAPIIQELAIDRPAVHVVRTAANRFNFSDLIAGKPGAPQPAPPPLGKPFHFSVSNIRITDGKVWFEDNVLHQQHAAEGIQVGIPFIANLPADLDIFVEPLVRMRIDGSPFRIAGMAKPFATTPESILDLRLKNLSLPAFAGYLTQKLPIKVLQGTLSTKVQVHFVQPESGAIIRLGGSVAVAGLDIRDASNAPLVALKTGSVALDNVEPLGKSVMIGPVALDGLSSNLVLKRPGVTNFTPLAAAISGAPAPPAGPPAPPFEMRLQSVDLTNSSLKFTDQSIGSPTTVALDSVHIGLRNFATGKKAPPVSMEAQARIGAGTVAVKGTFDVAQTQVATEVTLNQIDLPPLQAFVQQFWAGTLTTGKLSAHAKIHGGLTGGKMKLIVQPTTAALETMEVRAPGDMQPPIQLRHFDVVLDSLDLVARQAVVKTVRVDGLSLSARRGPDGELSVSAFLRAVQAPPAAVAPAQPVMTAPASTRPAAPAQSAVKAPAPAPLPAAQPGLPPTPGEQPWRYRIESVALENIEANLEDDTQSQPLKVEFAPLNLQLKNVTSDFTKPFGLAVDGSLKPQGSFKIEGTAAIEPLTADLQVVTQRINVTPAAMFVSGKLNARLTSAFLSMNGKLAVARRQDQFGGSYRGNVTIGNLRMVDKVTNDRFLRWNALNANRIDAEFGAGAPRVRIDELVLSEFFARLILNGNGKLNLKDIVRPPGTAPTSLTREKPTGAPAPAAAAQGESARAPDHSGTGDFEIERTVLEDGNINFSDNFIKPNYSAQLTEIKGKIGAFGTRSTKPADLELQGEVNGSAPIYIVGSLNPFAPMAFVDIKAKADGIELSNLTPYSTKYTGYPITKGTLTVDVHYHLENQELTADNHLFISQLTFGDHVNSPHAVNLPIALAVSLLKDSKGEIKIRVPVSGALSNPQFNFGEVVWQAFSDLILKAVTSPFALLASAAGSPNQQLDYVEFQPGLATLTPGSQARLNTLATALKDRPALRLSIAGQVDPSVDREALRAVMFDRKVWMQKVKELRDRGESADVDTVKLTPDEYNKYLKMAYEQAKFQKPRNFLGLTKSLPPDEMKKLMLANTDVTDADLKALANARALAVRRFLGKQVNPIRLAVVAPKLETGGVAGKGKAARVRLAID